MALLIRNLEDVQNLIDGKVEESLTLDYKSAFPSNDQTAKEMSAFANTEGGTIIIGVECKGREPRKFTWVDSDGAEEKIQNIAATGIFPPLKTINVSGVQSPEDQMKVVLAVDIPKSFDSPHMVNGRYHKRLGSPSLAMSHDEVKNAMLGAGRIEALRFEVSQNLELAENTRNFVSRINDRYSGGTPLENREEMIFVPFHTDGWSAVESGGFLFAFPEKVEKALMDSYAKIHVLNSFFDSIKGKTHVTVHTMMDQSSARQNPTYSLALLLHTKLPQLIRSLQELGAEISQL